MKINIGSGNKRIPDYINIDSYAGSEPDHVLDLERDNLPFDNDSVDHVIAHHILEHLGDGFFHCIKELFRVCKHGTQIDIRVPHPRHDIFLIDPTHKRAIYSHTLDMFSKKRNKEDIRNGGSETPLGLIHDVDMRVIEYKFVLDPYWDKIFKNYNDEQCIHASRTHNNVIAEILITWSVHKIDEPQNIMYQVANT